MKAKIKIFIVLTFIVSHIVAQKQDYKNPKLSIEKRVEDLLQRMTLDEKIEQLQNLFSLSNNMEYKNGGPGNLSAVFSSMNPKDAAKAYNTLQKYVKENTRLGIPLLMHGEAVSGLMSNGMTTFPHSIAQASTWNPDIQYKMAKVIAAEAKARGYFQVLSPNINISDDARWGRLHESYGEDPYLVGEMGLAFVKGFEENGIVTTPKHFVANVGYGGRWSGSVDYSERALREMYFPPFKKVIMEGKSRSVMSSYNSIGGIPCTIDSWLLNDVLRNEWGFKGFVFSDYDALKFVKTSHFIEGEPFEIAAMGINGGLDVEAKDVVFYNEHLIEAVKKGLVSEALIDNKVKVLLTIKFELGLFDNPYVNEQDTKIINNVDNKELAREISQQSIVLLKNNNHVLPLDKEIKTIALLGPLAKSPIMGNYTPWGTEIITLYQGVKNEFPQSEILYEKGVDVGTLALPSIPTEFLTTANGEPGLTGEYFTNKDLSGKPTLIRIDKSIDFDWGEGIPNPIIPTNNFSIRWTGKLTSPKTGKFKIGCTVDDGVRLYINNNLVVDSWKNGTARLEEAEYEFEAGKVYDIKLEYYESLYNAVIKLGWSVTPPDISKAVELAAKSDVAIITVGAIDGEGVDRSILDLSDGQEELIKRVAATGTPVVVVLATGNVITMTDWIENVDAVVEAWYSGEEGGNAIASILSGAYCPGGKLPITFPKHVGQCPLYYYMKPGWRSSYLETGNEPLFPFGYGLSYTNFQYSEINVPENLQKDESVNISLKIKNTGDYDGAEVIQIYFNDIYSSIVTPTKQLIAFKRVWLKKGEEKSISFEIPFESFALVDKNMKRVVEKGDFEIMIGTSSTNMIKNSIVKYE